ncbi:MAG: 2-C-methyl-D-erythritol 4-phosphate cytidylyltransferase [Chloroflexi bacterium]|nr:2-C-methyl-D-erythritol 4-phosphate cytidylyltransferase [Chloroflexota bacterium]
MRERPNPLPPFPTWEGGTASVCAAAVIVAAGQSARMEGVDKLFALLLGKPLLAHTLAAFEAAPQIEAIVLVLSRESLERGRALVKEHPFSKVCAVCPGGPRRQDSVWNGLQCVPPLPWVAVHDGARPCVTPEVINRGLEEAARFGSAVAAVPVKDTIKIVGDGGAVRETPDRSKLWAVQTPQMFSREALLGAYRRFLDTPATDDASLMERAGHPVHLYLGSYANIKVTTPEDMTIAEALLRRLT